MKSLKIILFALALAAYLPGVAQVKIIQPPVLDNLCPGGNASTLGSITMEETVFKDIDTTNLVTGADGYFQLTIGSGFQFTGAGVITYVGLSTACTIVAQPVINSVSSNTSIYFRYKMNKPDYAKDLSAFVWSGITIKADPTTPPGTNANITRTACNAGTDAPQVGNNPSDAKVHAIVQSGSFSADLIAIANPVCAGNTVTLDAFPNCVGCTYDFIDVLTNTFVSQATNSYTTPVLNGNKQYKVKITQGGCATTSAPVAITVNPRPLAGTDFSSNPSSLLKFNFNSSDAAQTLTSYVINPNNYVLTFIPGNNNCNGCIYKSATNVYSFLPSAYYPNAQPNIVVNYTVTNSSGCTSLLASLSSQFQVQGVPVQGPSFASPSGPFCEGLGLQSITIDAGPGTRRAITSIVGNPVDAIAPPTGGPGVAVIDPIYGTQLYINYNGKSRTESINLNPNNHTSSYSIGIKVSYNDTMSNGNVVPGSDTGSFSITPGIGISGMPTLYYNDVCSSNKDTVSIIGIPSGGVLTFEKSINYQSAQTFTALPQKLSTIPTGQTYVEKFVPYYFFRDSLNSLEYDGALKVIYTITGSAGNSCQTTKVSRIYYFRNPSTTAQKVDIKILNPGAVCTGDLVTFQITTPLYTQPTNSGWFGTYYQDFYLDFGDGTYSPYGHSQLIDPHTTIITHKYTKSGDYKVRLKTSTFCPCPRCEKDTIISNVVGAYPTADFIVKNPVLNNGTKFISLSTVTDPANPADKIKTWHWKFDNTSSFIPINTQQTTHNYLTVPADPYSVIHVAETNYGCKDTIIKKIPVFPSYSTNNYLNNFEGTLNGWYQSGDYNLTTDSSSWKNMVPKGKKIIGKAGNKAWITDKGSDYGYSKYNQSEKSWVESPVFNLDTYKSPMLSFRNWGITQNQLDGASLQYTICDTSVQFGQETWKTVNQSAVNTGWYNSEVIVSKPGGEYPGWSGSTGQTWSQSSVNLDEIKIAAAAATPSSLPQSYGVRFRVVFASNADNPPGNFDGFAFDDFFVGQRNRKIVVEEFCDYRHYENKFVTSSLGGQVIRMQYHLRNLVPDDEISNQNKAEPSARALLYGVDEIPRAVIDGGKLINDPFYDASNWGSDAVFKRSLQLSPFSIDVKHTVTGNNQLNITAAIVKDSTTMNASLVAQIAIVEDSVTANGIKFTNVVRNLLPDASGHHIGKWSGNQNLTAQWKPFVKPQSGLKIIVFVQDEDTKEIYQAAVDSVNKTIATQFATGRTANASDKTISDFILYPNPSSGSINLALYDAMSKDSNWRITNMYGEQMLTGILSAGNSFTTIGVSGLNDGVYNLQLGNGSDVISKTFTLIR